MIQSVNFVLSINNNECHHRLSIKLFHENLGTSDFKPSILYIRLSSVVYVTFVTHAFFKIQILPLCLPSIQLKKLKHCVECGPIILQEHIIKRKKQHQGIKIYAIRALYIESPDAII